MSPRGRPRPTVLLLAVVALVLAACDSGASGEVRWRDVRFTMPDGWVVHEDADGYFSISDAPFGTEEDPGPGVVGAFFSHRPELTVDDWRSLLEDTDAVVEEDTAITVDGAPARRFVFRQTQSRVPTREMVVVVPSRDLEVLLQPAPSVGTSDGPETFERFRDTFDAIVESIRFAPRDTPGPGQ